jgi:phosphopantetheinyl transferase
MTTPVAVLVCQQIGKDTSRSEWRSIVVEMIESIVKSPVILSFDELGKPSINHPDTSISYSHTKGTLVLALTHNNVKIGIDAEDESRISDINEIKNTAFSENELYPLKSDLVSNWCLKEAAVKMCGRGFYDHNPGEITMSTSGQFFSACVFGKEIIRGYFEIIKEGPLVMAICSNKRFSPTIKYWKEPNKVEIRNAA